MVSCGLAGVGSLVSEEWLWIEVNLGGFGWIWVDERLMLGLCVGGGVGLVRG